MQELLYELAPYAPLVIFIAAALDVFFLTGYLFYGFAMASTIAMMYTSGMISAEALVIAAFAGTYTGNLANFAVGHFFSERNFIQKRLASKHLSKAKALLKPQRLFIFMTICRNATLLRPAYALLLGSLGTKKRKFMLFEAVIAFCWVSFWTLMIVQGKDFIFLLTG